MPARFARRDRAWHTWTLAFVDALCWLGASGRDEELLLPPPPEDLWTAPEGAREYGAEVGRRAPQPVA